LTSHRRLVVNANIQSITVLCFANIYLFSTFFLLPMKTDFLLVLSFGFRVMSCELWWNKTCFHICLASCGFNLRDECLSCS
jgi:hypothetical protein